MNFKITGTGSCIPEVVVTNQDFMKHRFYTEEGNHIDQAQAETIAKFEAITGINARRYAKPEQQTSDLGTDAARKALADSGIDPEELDGIFVAHNFGNISHGKVQSDILPCLASRVKHDLKIENPNCIAFDILYGCPGWLQALITAYHYARSGEGRRFLVVGAETLSRKLDPLDRDSMIFADGAGASVLEVGEAEGTSGILSTISQTYTAQEAYYLHYDVSHKPQAGEGIRYVKMKGRKIFEFALSKVPAAMKACLERANIPIEQVKKVLLHQANEKMDEAIIKRFYRLYKMSPPEEIMPMSIHWLGNSSVATVPTLLDMLRRGEMDGHALHPGDVILMASVGAGMSINAVTYRV